MKTHPTDILTPSGLWLAVLAILLAGHAVRAQTLVSGNISGTWTPAGNPYIAVDNCTVPSGQTLRLQPGVVLLIGSNVSVTADGQIQAVGTPSQRITVRAPVSSQRWSAIIANYSGETNRFKYCDFSDAVTAIVLPVYGGNRTMFTEIMNCTFTNCENEAIWAGAQGLTGFNQPGGYAVQQPTIKNCTFSGTGHGCKITIWGDYFTGPAYGYADPIIIGNIFKDLSGSAFYMEVLNYAGGGNPVFINNTIVNCRLGVDATDPWDARVQGNIFVGATNAVKVSGSLSRTVSYNSFYGNATNFTGLPGTYGSIIFANRNGTPSDILFNIFQNPLFVATNDFHLATNSPCVDAGTPDWAFTDMCFPPSRGSSFPDQGAYGGPDACNWLDAVPLLPVTLTASYTNGMGRLSWGALPRSTYRIQFLTNLVSAGPNAWIDWIDVVATDKATSVTDPVARPETYVRVKSLGRTPGN